MVDFYLNYMEESDVDQKKRNLKWVRKQVRMLKAAFSKCIQILNDLNFCNILSTGVALRFHIDSANFCF